MNIVIAGGGKVGANLTRQLQREGHDVVVVDDDPAVLQGQLEQYDVIMVQGNAAAMDTLRLAKVEQADLLIAVTGADEINILSCLTARRLNRQIHTIARVRNPEYKEQLYEMREMLGLSLSVNPELSTAREIHHLLQLPAFLHRETFARGLVEIVELVVNDQNGLDGVQLKDLYDIAGVKVLVCAVLRQGEITIPGGDFVLRKGDHLYVTARTVHLAQLIKNLHIAPKVEKIRQVLLVGGGRISYYLTQRLLASGIKVKILEQDPVRAEHLARLLPKAAVVLGDGSSQEVLEREGLDESDALVTLTGMDEENIVISMYGHAMGVCKVVTKVNRLEYSNMFSDLGVGSLVIPKELCSASIVRYVRAMNNKQTGSVLTLHRIANGLVEALEFRVDANVRWRDTPLKDVPLKQGVLISCITRQGEMTIPDGTSVFRQGDTVVVVVTASDNTFLQMNDIFEA